ncbi:FkbM family methyltransferase [Bradyrhizobium sp. AUGA SZCCT0222]|uniref:FkbM family methyltransferase n=1 Tax=Bradyrhizobium sp. AUGA SZCCT0222 TaxID=2807668 RepID=UPI002011B094|nr:FkbM family methyltransferase [Bradyrhizobium sp. AUGA SZCCT0222]
MKMDRGAFDYEVSGSRLSMGLVRLLDTAIGRISGRGIGVAMQAIRPLLNSQLSCVHFADGSRMFFRLDDAYWNSFIRQPDTEYEPEIGKFLLRLKDVDYVFFDCGANIGYWSVLVTSEMLGRKRAVAVEASRETLAILQQNCIANDRRFAVYCRALCETDGQKLLFFTNGPHAARHIVEPQSSNSTHLEAVISTSVDALARQLQLTDSDRIIVKLDVEGAEISALKGAHRALKRDTLVIFEDHGQDRSHATTRFVLDELGFPVFSITADGAITEIKELVALDRLKADPKRGYNFVTCPPGSGFHRWIAGIADSARSC